MEFKEYESKPVIRRAFQITEDMKIEISSVIPSTYYCTQDEYQISFKAYEEPKVGDWIVRLTESDTYHCTDEVFRERNVVPE